LKAGSGVDTWHLATSRLEIISDRKARIAMRTVLVSVLLALGVLAGLRLYNEAAGPLARAASLEARNASLEAELARLRAALEFERATRAALERQVVELNEQSSQLASQLNFLNAQNGRSSAGQARD
jgi:septal ring factor EnvC (AmiA/AmiB activator)